MTLQIAIRADASDEIGHGHIMRCLTLANKLSEAAATCTFITRDLPRNLAEKLAQQGHGHVLMDDESQVGQRLAKLNPDWLIIDHYDIDAGLEQEWLQSANQLKVMVIDDLANRPHACDLLLDLTPGRLSEAYEDLVPEDCVLCLGSDYALIDDRFVALRAETLKRRKDTLEIPQLLITLGGGQVTQEMRIVSNAVADVGKDYAFSTTVIGENLEGELFQSLNAVEVIPYTQNMPERIGNADICIGAAGGTSWERCCLGLPTIALQIADNQKDNFNYLKKSDAALCVELSRRSIANALRELLASPSKRSALTSISSEICDGRGAKRMREQILSQSMSIRPASIEDAEFIYKARYDGDMEQFYRNPNKPDFEDHVAWLEQALNSDQSELMIAELKGQRIGHLRYDNSGEVSIYLAAEFRGKKLGSAVLLSALEHLKKQGVEAVHAEVHHQNSGSAAAFLNAGFSQAEGADELFLRYVWTSDRERG